LTLQYADTSAIARAYLPDEPEHHELRRALLRADGPVVTSEVARIEVASAIMSASRSGRATGWQSVLATVEKDMGPDGPITLISLRRAVILATAYRLVLEHRLRTLDAIHLAVAIEECPGLAAGEEVAFVTRGRDQAAAAGALGLTVR